METRNNIIPSLYVKTKGESTAQVSLKLTTAPTKWIVRVTGGCGYMSPQDGEHLIETFSSAFSGYKGSLIFGGTQMRDRDTNEVVCGITEVVPAIQANNPEVVSLGIIAKCSDINITNRGLIISDNNDDKYITFCHPQQNIALIVQKNPDTPSKATETIWDMEYQEAMEIISDLRQFAEMRSLLVSYNGGKTTEKEILATAQKGWPILLVKGSGRITDQYATDISFLSRHPHVHTCENNSYAIRNVLIKIGLINNSSNIIKLKKTS